MPLVAEMTGKLEIRAKVFDNWRSVMTEDPGRKAAGASDWKWARGGYSISP